MNITIEITDKEMVIRGGVPFCILPHVYEIAKEMGFNALKAPEQGEGICFIWVEQYD